MVVCLVHDYAVPIWNDSKNGIIGYQCMHCEAKIVRVK